MKIYLTRHGTTEWNIERRLQGWENSKLTQEGVLRAVKLGERLKDIDFDVIYSSPLNRAVETAKYIRGDKDTLIVYHDGLKELRYGIWQGMLLDDIEKKYPEEYYIYRNSPMDYIPIEGESYDDLFRRVKNFLEEVKKIEAENILVISHGITIKAIIAYIKNLSLEEFSSLPVYTGTALNIIEVDKGKMKLILENDTSHIDGTIINETNI
ncbi:MAG: histidine phosphatase family protein [Tissierellia bacterium]|nr:histidine phosphatase family protein [Tissierellia bacterium]